MRSLVALLCLGLLASTPPVEAKKPPVVSQRGSRDAGEGCATAGACKAGLKCVAATCRTPEWVAGAAIIVDHAREVEAELNVPLERRHGGWTWNAMVRASVVMQATRAAMPDASEFDVRVALQNGDVPFEGVLDSFRLMAVESGGGRASPGISGLPNGRNVPADAPQASVRHALRARNEDAGAETERRGLRGAPTRSDCAHRGRQDHPAGQRRAGVQ